MTENKFRPMKQDEQAVVDRLLSSSFPGRSAIEEQLRQAHVRTIDENGSLEFLVSPNSGILEVRYAVPTEGEYEDEDGVTVHVLLHVVSDRVTVLELYRNDNKNVRKWPEPDSLRIFAPS